MRAGYLIDNLYNNGKRVLVTLGIAAYLAGCGGGGGSGPITNNTFVTQASSGGSTPTPSSSPSPSPTPTYPSVYDVAFDTVTNSVVVTLYNSSSVVTDPFNANVKAGIKDLGNVSVPPIQVGSFSYLIAPNSANINSDIFGKNMFVYRDGSQIYSEQMPGSTPFNIVGITQDNTEATGNGVIKLKSVSQFEDGVKLARVVQGHVESYAAIVRENGVDTITTLPVYSNGQLVVRVLNAGLSNNFTLPNVIP
ncbi:MAG: hypothetical protein HY831_02895 [Candidatus Aenigmarchaeota archaeon]|nr:hypothetical protein [Candidatus Aenigmarchaeota archaeon]